MKYSRDAIVKRIIVILTIAAVLAAGSFFLVTLGEKERGKVPSAKETGIVINEVVSQNSYSLHEKLVGSPDWIELKNTGDKKENLLGYTLSKDEEKTYTFGDMEMAPGESILLCACESYYDSEHICIGYKLSKEGETLTLADGEGDKLWEFELPQLDEDISYGIFDGKYCYSDTPTPGFENTGRSFETLEEAVNAPAIAGVTLNEACNEFAELYNGTDMPLCLSMFCLSDNFSNTDKGQLPAVMLEPGEYYTAGFGGSDAYDTSLDFGISKDEAVCLFTREKVISSLDTSAISFGMSMGAAESGETVFFLEKTPGKKNSATYFMEAKPAFTDGTEGLRINEIMLKNRMCLIDEDGDRSDWAELYNASGETLDLSDYYLSDDEEDILKWRLPEIKLGAGEYIVIYLSGKSREYHTNFKVGAGESLVLTDMKNFRSSKVFFPDEGRLEDVSYGLKDGKWYYFGKGTPGRENSSHGSENAFGVEKLDSEGVFITETSATSEPRSGKKDWIELYNAGKNDFDLSGCYLSNDEDELMLCELSGSIPAGGYKVVYASSKPKLQTDGVCTFGLSTAGESLFLTDGNGSILDCFETGYQRAGISSGRIPGDFSGKRVFFSTPTPGEENRDTVGSYLKKPEFSLCGGRYEAEIEVKISGEGDIYYTLDGSSPEKNGTLYEGPIKLSKNTVISAVALKEGRLASDTSVATYLFDEAHSLPVICITIDDADFRSVCSAVDRTGPKIERKCYFEYYETDGLMGTEFPAGLRICGNSTRTYSQKSFNVYLRGGYGQSSVTYPFFDDYGITEFKSLNLRNSGQDHSISRLSDIYSSTLMRGLDLDYAEGRFAVLYINGSYHGLYDLKENQNEDWLASKYDVDPDSVCLIRRNLGALNGTNTGIKKVYSMAQSGNMADSEKYESFLQYVDGDAFIDYIIAQAFCGNGDMFNQKLWYTKDFGVRVRPVFYDLDFAFHSAGASILGHFFTGDGVASPDGTLTNMYIPTALKKNEEWREKFLSRASYFINEYLEGYLDLFDRMVAEMDTEMERHIGRWHTPSSYSTWKHNVSDMRSFVSKRPEALVRQIKSVFSVSDEKMHELFPKYG